jgi:hypothetical protein
MTTEGHKVASLHGAKDAAERDAIIDRFREGREKVCSSSMCWQGVGEVEFSGFDYHECHRPRDRHPSS